MHRPCPGPARALAVADGCAPSIHAKQEFPHPEWGPFPQIGWALPAMWAGDALLQLARSGV